MQADDLQAWHRVSIDNPLRVAQLLRRLADEGTILLNGMDHRNLPRTAVVARVEDRALVVKHTRIAVERQPTLVFSFELDGTSYSMAGTPIGEDHNDPSLLRMTIPKSIHVAERRGRLRQDVEIRESVWMRLQGQEPSAEIAGEVVDRSRAGLGLRVPNTNDLREGTEVLVRFGADARDISEAAVVRHRKTEESGGWLRLGLAVQPPKASRLLPVDSREQVLPGGIAAKRWSRVALARRTIGLTSSRIARRISGVREVSANIEVVEFPNGKGQRVRGIVDRTAQMPGGPAIVVPPAWGRTKETLLPLARTLVETFAAAGKPLTVLRFDGTQRRGESYVDPTCRAAGDENLRFTFSQAADDVNSAARFLQTDERFQADRLGLVTFSLAALEGRLAIADPGGPEYSAWIAVVGMTDVQSALKSVSGGSDYVGGNDAGVEFGIHELGGVRIDIDHAALDVLKSDVATLEEAKRDIARISCPLTWIHGRDDGWTDIERVREMLSVRGGGPKKLLEVPTGHQLRTSTEALDTFQLIANEVSTPLCGEQLKPVVPRLVDLDLRNRNERARVRGSRPKMRKFWQDYLLGQNAGIGMQLLGATEFFREFMNDQIDRLNLEPGMRVLDLGAGTGEFCEKLLERPGVPNELDVVAADFVPEALSRARLRCASSDAIRLKLCAVNAEDSLPFADHSFDRVVASLLIAYLEDGPRLMAEIFRVLKPGGIVVVSSPKRDADLSSLYRETLSEVGPQDLMRLVGAESAGEFDEVQRAYLNEAARLLDYEEHGHFEFRDPPELVALLSEAGFTAVDPALGLGNPPQTSVVTGLRSEA